MRNLAAALVVSVIALAASQPVAAKNIPRTGDRIDLFAAPLSMPADEPFWVGHGWCTTADDADPVRAVLDPTSRFELAVDGQAVATGTDLSFDVSFPDGVTCIGLKTNYHNFRSGLPAGSHTITGCWFLVGELQFCEEAVIGFE
jgi:hypothetical protein